MPLFFHYQINKTSKLAIWHITEEESFFANQIPLQSNITHPHKRLQHLAGRYLLQFLFPDFPYSELQIADTRKPFLPGEQYHFSISHCGAYAAAIASSTNRVGIDIEIPSEKVSRISHKFIHPAEAEFISINNLPLYNETLIWSAKEAAFKWYGLGQVDFKAHIRMLSAFEKNHRDSFLTSSFVFQKEESKFIPLLAAIFEELCCCWVCTAID